MALGDAHHEARLIREIKSKLCHTANTIGLVKEQQCGKCGLLGMRCIKSYLDLNLSIYIYLCPIQGPQGKQGLQGLSGIDGPAVSTKRQTT